MPLIVLQSPGLLSIRRVRTPLAPLREPRAAGADPRPHVRLQLHGSRPGEPPTQASCPLLRPGVAHTPGDPSRPPRQLSSDPGIGGRDVPAPPGHDPLLQARGVTQPNPASRDEGSRRGRPPSPGALRGPARRGDGGARLALSECPVLPLLLSLLFLPLGLPVLGTPARLICDSRVLERYILEAKEAENVTMGCADGCSLHENVTVPDTKVNFYAWRRMEVGQQAIEVWQGLALLSEAILRGQALLANSSQPSDTLQLHVDKAVSGLRSLTSLLRALGIQKEAISPSDAASAAPLRTFTVDTLCKLFRIYSNFLRGKLKLYTGEACRRADR
ncbi:erythropoietin [Sciurus carolinensis]|uniref:erythropoietin n=1 Tax=Sciurus carolinensis TaxID=30640 RepID=UPI001FB31D35|nr:erythropoietin [Sciurus carolinensis]